MRDRRFVAAHRGGPLDIARHRLLAAWAADAQKAAVKAHAAAREMASKSAIAAAHAPGHAVATAHMADHSLGSALYAQKAIVVTGASSDIGRVWHIERLPDEVRELIVSALNRRLAGRGA